MNTSSLIFVPLIVIAFGFSKILQDEKKKTDKKQHKAVISDNTLLDIFFELFVIVALPKIN